LIAISQDRLKQTELAILMRQLIWDRCLRINKYKILSLVDKTNDAAGNWKFIADALEDMGGDPSELRYLPLRDSDMLIMLGEPYT
jgi:hypothetical protein